MPCSRSTSSSTQSVNGQPVAVPDSMPTHSGVSPLAIILSSSALNSVKVVGTSYPLSFQTLGTYQTSDLRSFLIGTPYCVPSTLENARKLSSQFSATADLTSSGSASRSPSWANWASLPGWGKAPMSGGLPPSTCVLICCSKSRRPTYVILIPFASPNLVSASCIAPASF